jgi:uncharacterized protein
LDLKNDLPSKRNALKLLTESGCSQQVIVHCRAVESLALKIARGCKKDGIRINIKLIQIGALLHDIGRSKTHGVNHVIEGARIAKSLNLPISVISIIERHAGGGIAIDEAKKMGWPAKTYLPQSTEEKIITYADKLIDGTQKVNIEQSIEKLARKLGDNHSTIERVRKLHKEFSKYIFEK